MVSANFGAAHTVLNPMCNNKTPRVMLGNIFHESRIYIYIAYSYCICTHIYIYMCIYIYVYIYMCEYKTLTVHIMCPQCIKIHIYIYTYTYSCQTKFSCDTSNVSKNTKETVQQSDGSVKEQFSKRTVQ